MSHIRKILCPLDLQTASFDALHSASQLSKHYNAELVVLNVVPSAVPPAALPLVGELIYASPEYAEEMQKHARKNLNQALRDALPPDVTARAVVTIGRIANEIMDVAEREGCDLIVMEPHDAPGLIAHLFGSNCEKVLRQSEVPVWLARTTPQPRHSVDDPHAQDKVTGSDRELEPLHIRKILCTTDGSEPARAALQLARDMALEMHAELCVLHVYQPLEPVMGIVSKSSFDADLKREARELIERETTGFTGQGVSFRPLIRAGIPALEILDAIGEEHPDLTIIATHGYSGWKRLTMGSVAEPVARLATCPVLTVHQPSEKSATKNASKQGEPEKQFSYVSGPRSEPEAEIRQEPPTPAEPPLPVSSFSPEPIAPEPVAPEPVAPEPVAMASVKEETPNVEAASIAVSASEDGDVNSAWDVNADDFPEAGTREEKLRFLLQYAILAPSNRNTQPWLWRITESGLELYADTSRSLPKVDPLDRELFIACGAALFNLRVALRYFGCEFETHLLSDANAPDFLARIPISFPEEKSYTSGSTGIEAAENAELFNDITRRHTARGVFEDRPLEAGLHIRLKEAAREEGALLRFVEADERERVAELVKRATIFQASDPWLRHEWEKWIRHSPEARQDGLQREAIGMSAAEKPSTYGSYVKRSNHDKEVVETAPTLVLLETEGDTPHDWLNAGAALQHVLLMARAGDVFASYFNQIIEVTDVWRTLRNQLGLLCHPQLLFRLGTPVAPDDVIESSRRPVKEVVTSDMKTSRALGEYVSSRNLNKRRRR